MLLFNHWEMKPLSAGVWWEMSVYYQAILVTFLQCTFQPFKTHIFRVKSGINNPIILCLSEVKFLGVSSKGRRHFLMPFIYQKKLNPLEQSGCKGQPCHPSGQPWHPVTCHILEHCTDCQAWHCFPFELRTTQGPQASSETGEGQGKNLLSALKLFQDWENIHHESANPRGASLVLPNFPAPGFALGTSALPSAHHPALLWWTALHQDSSPWPSQDYRGKSHPLLIMGDFSVFTWEEWRLDLTFKKYHLQSCKVLQRWELLTAHSVLRSPSEQQEW